jgi:hypothetical protein
MDLGTYAYNELKYQNTLTLNMFSGRWERRPFNPAIVVAAPWGQTAEARDLFRRTHQARWGVYPDEINGNKGLELYSEEALAKFCIEHNIDLPKRGATGQAATVGNMSEMLTYYYDSIYVAKGDLPLWYLISPVVDDEEDSGTTTAPDTTDLQNRIKFLEQEMANLIAATRKYDKDIAQALREIASLTPVGSTGGGKYANGLRRVRNILTLD